MSTLSKRYSFRGIPLQQTDGEAAPPIPALVRSWGQPGKIKCTLSPSRSVMLVDLKLATKILVLQWRGVNDGSGEDSKEPAQVLLLPVNQYRRAITNVL